MATASPYNQPLSTFPAMNATSMGAFFWGILKLAGSLKITCTMFALGVLILFVGTLAQDESTIVDVKKEYFNSWIAIVPFDVFMPQTIWPHQDPISYAFAIPGGATVGWILLFNLIAAKVTRFPMVAKGKRFIGGLILTLVGFALIALIVMGAHLGDGLQGEPPFSYDAIWYGSVATLWASIVGLGTWSFWSPPKHSILKSVLWTFFGMFLAVGLFLAFTGETYRIPDPGLRIVWQLAKSALVSGVLLAGLILLFGHRGGNVLIHLGIALIMVGQFVFGDQQREERIALFEGQRTSAAVQTDIVELAVIDTSLPDKNRVVAFDYPLLESSAAKGTYLTDKSLPFEIRVDRYMVNSDIQPRRSDPKLREESAELIGLPPEIGLIEVGKSGGAKSEMNFASAYLSIREKKTSKELGKFAVSQFFNDPTVRPVPILNSLDSDGRSFDLALRFRRNLKPFSFELKDVVLEQYTGTAIPKDYSSYVRIVDEDGATLQEGRIWMNSPMRFRGETYYQSQYTSAEQSPMGVEQTVLQVVTNAGWLIPYVSCVLVGLGMLAHFSITLTRFASRYERNAIKKPVRQPWFLLSLLVPVVVIGGILASRAKPPAASSDKIDWYRIGTLPVQHEGRMKPLSGVGSQLLKALSNKPYALTSEGHSYEGGQKTGKQVTSAQWLMSVFAHADWVMKAPLVRIDSQALLDELGLQRHKSNCYSVKQISEKLDGMEEKTRKILERKREDWSFDEQKFMDLQQKLMVFYNVWGAYEPVDEILKTVDSPEKLSRAISALEPLVESLNEKNPPAMIPPREAPEELDPKLPPPRWHAYVSAFYDMVRNFDANKTDNPTTAFRELTRLIRQGSGKSKEVNQAVASYEKMLDERYGAMARLPKTRFEAWYEYFNPIGLSYMLYVVSGLTALIGFAVARERFRQAAFWLCLLTLALHTIAIASRIYISERPPVVNLYSAAVFIGWAVVLACVVAEVLFPISISLLIASVAGFLSLQVAYGLDIGDSMPVLQAVLDTQFWLSTHVISVSLGYSATFLAGFLGIFIIGILFAKHWVRSEQQKTSYSSLIDVLYRICYGVVCFGIFFSFVGTVLGGLWGDDSWGRFWGWDPKENGALMIVLWNALLLHARWDKLVGALGFAMLAVVGNIITAWSMFGTNILGIGLHAYGGEPGDSIRNMAVFVASQLAIIALGGVTYLMTASDPSAIATKARTA
ncbi:MAG: cytochrome c biogenesis protein CcsA [Pirellula sp.]|jgi:ABC-type transport system involved in cytochrome c biogenesis permease subunit|nr:cytochrome c biogenesis protein CcsA [Pirellula sp.]